MPESEFIPNPSSPFHPSGGQRIRAGANDISAAALELAPDHNGVLLHVEDLQVSVEAATTLTIREKNNGAVLLKQHLSPGSTPLPPFETNTRGKGIEAITSSATPFNADGIYH